MNARQFYFDQLTQQEQTNYANEVGVGLARILEKKTNLEDFLDRLYWDGSIQGGDYWYNIFKRLNNENI